MEVNATLTTNALALLAVFAKGKKKSHSSSLLGHGKCPLAGLLSEVTEPLAELGRSLGGMQGEVRGTHGKIGKRAKA